MLCSWKFKHVFTTIQTLFLWQFRHGFHRLCTAYAYAYAYTATAYAYAYTAQIFTTYAYAYAHTALLFYVKKHKRYIFFNRLRLRLHCLIFTVYAYAYAYQKITAYAYTDSAYDNDYDFVVVFKIILTYFQCISVCFSG